MISAFNMLKNKYYLYLTEFFAGMSVMAVELGASRLLAPYFSSSQIVWTIIIGTIIKALEAEAFTGHQAADSPTALYDALDAGGVVSQTWKLGLYFFTGRVPYGVQVLCVNNRRTGKRTYALGDA